eukprot:2370439-Pleurochrysis_carterae.AAC.2
MADALISTYQCRYNDKLHLPPCVGTGAFRKLISLLEPRNVTELSYRYRDSGQAIVYLSFQVLLGAAPRLAFTHIEVSFPRFQPPCSALKSAGCSVLQMPMRKLLCTANEGTVEQYCYYERIKHFSRHSRPYLPSFDRRYDVGACALAAQASCPLDKQKALQALGDDGCQAIDLTDNELAKAHARHLAGGRSSVENEFIYRFEFPERPGALVTFLDTLNAGWNVTMFHYRNHGSDVGRVLAGIQVPTEEKPLFDDFLQRLHYRYFAETDNPAVKHFFRP